MHETLFLHETTYKYTCSDAGRYDESKPQLALTESTSLQHPFAHSSMHHALSLPEVVSTILGTFQDTNLTTLRLLHNCLFVNSLFSLEATRILWQHCGSDSWAAPRIRHLVHLILKDAERAQFYANFIRIIVFNSTVDVFDWPDDTSTDEVQYHQVLRRVEFPALETVFFDGTPQSKWFNTTEAVLHYVQPRLRRFHLGVGLEVSDDLFEALSAKAPGLRKLTIRVEEDKELPDEPANVALLPHVEEIESDHTDDEDDGDEEDDDDDDPDYPKWSDDDEEEDEFTWTIPLQEMLRSENIEIERFTSQTRRKGAPPKLSHDALSTFLSKVPHLTELVLSDVDLGAAWNITALQAMATHAHLHTLWPPTIPDEWAIQLERATPLQVDDLRIRLETNSGFMHLVPFLSKASTISFCFTTNFMPALPALTDFSNLTALSLDLARPLAVAFVKDLIQLSQGCQRLQKLDVLINLWDPRSFEPGVKPDPITEFASNLPELRELRLESLTLPFPHSSFVILANTCKNLHTIHLTVDIDFVLVADLPARSLSHLRLVDLSIPRDHQNYSDEQPNSLADRLRGVMPNVDRFMIRGGAWFAATLKEALGAW